MFKEESIPVPGANVGPGERIDATLEAYGKRKTAIERANARARTAREWAETASRVYENSSEKPLSELREELRKLESPPSDP